MNLSLALARSFYFVLCIVVMTLHYMGRGPTGEIDPLLMLMGAFLGGIAGGFLLLVDFALQRFRLRDLLLMSTGLIVGTMLAWILWSILFTALDHTTLFADEETRALFRTGTILFSTYIGVIFTLRSADEWYLSIPFVRLKPQSGKKRDLLLDISAMTDPRLIDLAASGLLDQQLVIPRALLNDLYENSEQGEEQPRQRARRALETIKKLESMHELGLRFDDTALPKEQDGGDFLSKLARLLNANILSAEASRIQASSTEGVRNISLHSLSNCLKPIMQSGERIEIKIQRHGKEPRQGVGYLEDGTMVVVNGGGDFILQTIPAQVLSVKHTSSGRMIFCNALGEAPHGLKAAVDTGAAEPARESLQTAGR
jgi:uncharacterized protein YacL